jgi:hypothetical protein
LTTVLEKLKALDAQRAQLLDGAKKEALENAERAVAELNELGACPSSGGIFGTNLIPFEG